MDLISVLALLHCLAQVSAFVHPGYLVPPKCPPCDAKSCPQLTFCAGVKVKDHCGCCPRCSSDLFQPHVDVVVTHQNETSTAVPAVPAAIETSLTVPENACEKRKCPKFQVCMVNVQGLAICTCPSLFVCKRGGRRRSRDSKDVEVCGNDGITYESSCHIRIANCNSKKRIKRLHPGACTEAERKRIEDEKLLPDIIREAIDKGNENDEESLEQSKKLRKKKRKKGKKGRKNKKDRRSKRKRNKGKKRKDRKEKKGRMRRKRTKRRHDGFQQYLYPSTYGELIGRHTQWSSSQVRKSKI